MPKILMTTVKGHRYGGKWRNPGDQYEATGRGDARLMVALKHAVEAQPVAAPAVADPVREHRGTYQTTHQVAESNAAPAKKVAAKKAAAKTSGYKRRDQVAEE